MKDQQFNYKYVAPTEEERQEIASIRKQYFSKDKCQTKLERLRWLDNRVKTASVVPALCLGVLGCLVFGLGLTFVLEWNNLWWGVACCVVGAVPMAFAYPTYKRNLNKMKQLHSEEILRLSEELLNESN